MTHDIVFSFDTTGSMRPCITQVRNVIKETVKRLFKDIPFLRIGLIAHGDYVDGVNCLLILPLTNNQSQIEQFVTNAPATNGGDAAECYEYVLHTARDFEWQGYNRALVLIGDDLPHEPGSYQYGRTAPNWRSETNILVERNVRIYPVQALNRSYANKFYDQLALMSGTPKIELDQFADMPDILMALTYQNAGQLNQFEQEIKVSKRKVSRSVMITLDKLAGRKLSKRSETVGSKYQVIDVANDSSIKGFVENNGLRFSTGRGFYEWTKTETIQDYKEVIAQNKLTGAIITGKRARTILGIDFEVGRFKPTSGTHRGFIQSTSVNRKLIHGTKFLYEVI